MDLLQHPDGKTYRRVGSLEGTTRDLADRLMARRSRADRKKRGLTEPEQRRDGTLLICGHIEGLAHEVEPGVFVCRACEFAQEAAAKEAASKVRP